MRVLLFLCLLAYFGVLSCETKLQFMSLTKEDIASSPILSNKYALSEVLQMAIKMIMNENPELPPLNPPEHDPEIISEIQDALPEEDRNDPYVNALISMMIIKAEQGADQAAANGLIENDIRAAIVDPIETMINETVFNRSKVKDLPWGTKDINRVEDTIYSIAIAAKEGGEEAAADPSVQEAGLRAALAHINTLERAAQDSLRDFYLEILAALNNSNRG